ncbi:MAG: RNA polymerase sigma factor [Polyangiaceae bacterium]
MPLPSNAGSATTEDAEARELDAAMDRFARGDDAAFEQVYRLGAGRVQRFLLRMGNDAALADDLTQDTFLRVHAARGAFELGATARPWLLAIARNTFLDSMRRAKVRRKSADATKAAQQAEPPMAAGETQGDEALIGREMLDLVSTTLAKLSPLVREAFVLVRFEGLTMNEAAEVLGTTEAAVKVRAFRAYEALREALGPELGVGEGAAGKS